jgi:hypothetical protein
MGDQVMSSRFPYLTALSVLSLLGLAMPVPAQLHIHPQRLDLGEIKTGQRVQSGVSWVNGGPRAVEIGDVKGSCGCVKLQLPKRTLTGGQHGFFPVEVNTVGQPGGPTTWSVRISCRSGDELQEIVLPIHAQLIEEVAVRPAALQLFANEVLTASIQIQDQRPQAFQVTAVQTSSPQLEAWCSQDKNNALWVVQIQVRDDYPEGRREEVVSIHTDDPAYAELTVPVTVVKTSRQRISATPGTVVLSSAAGQPVPSRVVLVRDSQDEPVTIENVSTDHPALWATWASGPGSMATLKVRVDHRKLPGEGLRSRLLVAVSQPVRQTVAIPVEVRRWLSGSRPVTPEP